MVLLVVRLVLTPQLARNPVGTHVPLVVHYQAQVAALQIPMAHKNHVTVGTHVLLEEHYLGLGVIPVILHVVVCLILTQNSLQN